MAAGFIRFELADGELIDVNDNDVGGISRELRSHKSRVGSSSTATRLRHEVQRPQRARRTIELTQVEGEALCEAMARERFLMR